MQQLDPHYFMFFIAEVGAETRMLNLGEQRVI